jgi:hypothetical protein
MTWEVDSTSGLGSNYKDVVKELANRHGYGSIYYAKRLSDYGGLHCFRVRTKKTLGLSKYEFIVYTHYDTIQKTEAGSGYGPDVKKL